MFRATGKVFAVLAIIGYFATSFVQTAGAKTELQEPRDVDLVIALDVSGSMQGLIESAKQRLWDIVNELGRAQPQPELRVAILSYGNPAYGPATGYVRIDQPFTRDLDAVNETLFAFGTDGGDEYVARVVDRSVKTLQWSPKADALRIIFVAGNESARQDPRISVEEAARAATEQGIVVSTIYCGSEADTVAPEWRVVANLTNGTYASIDQNAARVANIATPMDASLALLNEELNETYVVFGDDGARYRANQLTQDENAARMSEPAAASRAVTKAGSLYHSANWDLVDALESGKKLEEFEEKDLPREMQAMDQAERRDYLRERTERREALRREITELGKQRQVYIAEKRKEEQNESARGLDEVILEGLRSVAEKKGFTFDDSPL